MTLSKKTLCLALCALAAGNAVADDWWGNSASVSGMGSGARAGADADDWWGSGAAMAASGTAGAASAFANDRVQGSNTISGAGAVAEGYGDAESAAGVEGLEIGASTYNYNGGTESYADSDAVAYFNDEWYGTQAEGDGDFHANGYGDDIVGAMGGQANVALASESDDWGFSGGSAGLGVARSKGRQGQDDWHSRDDLMALDGFLDHETTGEFLLGSTVSVGAGIALSNVGK